MTYSILASISVGAHVHFDIEADSLKEALRKYIDSPVEIADIHDLGFDIELISKDGGDVPDEEMTADSYEQMCEQINEEE